jgi:hypothetical protein
MGEGRVRQAQLSSLQLRLPLLDANRGTLTQPSSPLPLFTHLPLSLRLGKIKYLCPDEVFPLPWRAFKHFDGRVRNSMRAGCLYEKAKRNAMWVKSEDERRIPIADAFEAPIRVCVFL